MCLRRVKVKFKKLLKGTEPKSQSDWNQTTEKRPREMGTAHADEAGDSDQMEGESLRGKESSWSAEKQIEDGRRKVMTLVTPEF